MTDGIYIPMSDRTLRKLDQLVGTTGFDEDTIISAALDLMLRKCRQAENDNTDDDFHTPAVTALPPEALSSDALAGSRSALGASNSEMPTG